MNKKIHVKKDDTVVLLTGKYEEKYDKNGNIIKHKVMRSGFTSNIDTARLCFSDNIYTLFRRNVTYVISATCFF